MVASNKKHTKNCNLSSHQVSLGFQERVQLPSRVQGLGDNLGSWTSCLPPVWAVHCPQPCGDLQRHHHWQVTRRYRRTPFPIVAQSKEHGLHWYHQVLQWDGREAWWAGDPRDSQGHGLQDEEDISRGWIARKGFSNPRGVNQIKTFTSILHKNINPDKYKCVLDVIKIKLHIYLSIYLCQG